VVASNTQKKRCNLNVAVILPPSHTHPYYHQTQHLPCPLSQATTIGRELPPSIMGARRRNLRLARYSADASCLCAHRYLHHAPPRPHPASHPHNTLACNHSSLPPPPVLKPPTPTPSNTLFFEPTPLIHANTQPPHALGKCTKEPWLYPPPPLIKAQSSVGRA